MFDYPVLLSAKLRFFSQFQVNSSSIFMKKAPVTIIFTFYKAYFLSFL